MTYYSFCVNTIRLLFMLTSIALISACSHKQITNQQALPQQLRAVSSVSYKAPYFAPTADTVFAYNNGIQLIIETEEAPVRANGEQLIEEALLNGLASKRYRVYRRMANANYYVNALLIMGETEHIKQQLLELGLAPQVGKAEAEYERGTLLVFITDDYKNIQWRGAVQIFSAPDTSNEIARQRINAAATTLFGTLPAIQ
jgi:hypothetical protein